MKVAIIGGGAAGMMSAAILALDEQFDGSITLYEKNTRLGAKVIISGGGRCNLTTGVYRTRELLTYYTRGADMAKCVFKSF
jgi:predicted flavoprotein YhiN